MKKTQKKEGIGRKKEGFSTIDMYENALKMRNYRAGTRKKNIQIIRKFLTSTSLYITKIKPKTVEDYLVSLMKNGRSGKTIENHRSAIKGFFDYLLQHKIIDFNPALTVFLGLILKFTSKKPAKKTEEIYTYTAKKILFLESRKCFLSNIRAI